MVAASRDEKIRLLRSLLQGKAQQTHNRKLASPESRFLGDTSLHPSIQSCGTARHLSDTSSILLTGATGFLGAHLLHDLCRMTNTTIFCLVRAESLVQARQRLAENLAQYSDSRLPDQRVIPVLGDLARDRLGLDDASFEQLASQVDVIFHNGAALNHLAPYERLRASNVRSTVEALRLAANKRPKWIYYVSSMIAAADRDSEGALLEQLPAGDPAEITGGYAQTKWVSECLLGEARMRGFGITVYRPGIIGGRRDTGAWAVAHDHLLLLLKSCQQMGCAPDSELTVDLTPVDFVSESIVRLSLAGLAHPVAHLSNPRPPMWTTLVGWTSDYGYPLRLVPFEVWQQKQLTQIDETNALFPLLSVYLDGSVIGQRRMLISKLSKVRREVTTPLLSAWNLEYPAIDREQWGKYLRHCRDCGFFPAPQQE
jgi:thioester reductase-like protein